MKTSKHNPVNYNFLDVITENLKKNNESKNSNAPPSFTQFLQTFMNQENVKNNDELKEEKEELNLKMEKMLTMKRQSQMSLHHLYNNFG